jgi:hypothetical protein
MPRTTVLLRKLIVAQLVKIFSAFNASCVICLTFQFSYDEGLSAPRLTPKLMDPPLSATAYSVYFQLHLEGRFFGPHLGDEPSRGDGIQGVLFLYFWLRVSLPARLLTKKNHAFTNVREVTVSNLGRG